MRAHGIEDDQGHFINNVIKSPLDVLDDVLAVCKNRQKAAAIQKVRSAMFGLKWGPGKDVPWSGFQEFKEDFVSHGRCPATLTYLPFIGPALSCHLARNLGNVNIFKPDLHLIRLAKHYGYGDRIQDMLSDMCDDQPAGLTDLMLWTASADHSTL